MQLLIDTHVLIWFLEGNNLLSKSHRQTIAAPDNNVFVSIVSLWEIAIKISVGKLTLAQPLAGVIKQLADENIGILALSPEHILQVSTLAFHHRDPFDRIIVSQAIVENMDIISADAIFDDYLTGQSISRIW